MIRHLAATAAAVAILAGSSALAAPMTPPAQHAGTVYTQAAYSETVRKVQAALNARGYDAGPVDGFMGSRTRSAIVEYQTENRLVVDGAASEALLAHIEAQRAKPTDDQRRANAIRHTQRRLALLGYDVEQTSEVDAKTTAAIRAYQRDQGLPVTGAFDNNISLHVRATVGARGLEGGSRDTGPKPDDTTLAVERGLDARGYKTGKVDGIADRDTEAAIRAYQRDRGVRVDGKVSQDLASALSVGMDEPANTPENIRAVQAALNERGYNAGPADGVMGPSTRSAILAYRRDKGLPASEDVTTRLLTSLDADASTSVATKPATETKPSTTGASENAEGVDYVIRLRDDFEDGEFESSPPWSIHSGQFSVVRGALATKVTADQASAQQTGQNQLATFLNQALGGANSIASIKGTSAIAQGNDLGRNFLVDMVILGAGNRVDQMHLGPYIGGEVTTGYRLLFDKAANNRLAIIERSDNGSRVLAEKSGVPALGDGRRHKLRFARLPDGRLIVQIDGETALTTSAGSYNGGFNGFSFVAMSGAWNIHEVTTGDAR